MEKGAALSSSGSWYVRRSPGATRSGRPSRAAAFVAEFERKPLGVAFAIDVARVAAINQMSQLVDQNVVEIEVVNGLFGPFQPPDAARLMGPQAAVNAVFYNQIQAIEDEAEREKFVTEKREEYAKGVDLLHLASEMVIDAVIEPETLRSELISRFEVASGRDRSFTERRSPITPA